MRRQTMHRSCSFCGKDQGQVERLIAGPPGIHICDACVALCGAIIDEHRAGPSAGRATGRHPVARRIACWWQRLRLQRRPIAHATP